MTDLTQLVGMTSLEAQDQRVETEVIEPTAVSQSQCKFLLPQKGLLSEDVFFTFKATGAIPESDFPLMAGGLSFIRRISIYYGNVLLADCDQLAHLLQLKNTFIDQDIRDQVYQTEICHFSGLQVDTNAAGVKGMYSVAGSYDGTGVVGLTRVGNTGVGYNKDPAFRLQTDTNTTPEISLPLKACFPFLTQTNLPLGLLNERLTVVIDWSDDLAGVRTISNQPTVAPVVNWAPGNNVDLTSCKLPLDLVYYDDKPNQPSPMARIEARLQSGIEMVYTDYVHLEEFLPAVAPAAPTPIEQNKIIRLGLDSQIVRNILMATPKQGDYSSALPSAMSNPILGDYNSRASQGKTTLQVKINNRNIFVNALDMDAKLWNELSQVYNTPAKSNIGLTSFVGQVGGANLALSGIQTAFPTDKNYAGHFESNLCGSLGYLGINLSRTYDNIVSAGIAVGKSPVEIDLTYQRTAENFEKVRLLLWTENERVMLIRNGTIFVTGS